jgi:type IV secretory pathway protease TraF
MDMGPPPANGSTPETYHRGRKRTEALAAVVVGVALAYSFLRWKPFRVEIAGSSMAPTLVAGDWALAVKPGRLRRGDIVVVEHPRRPGLEMVKRITGVPGEVAPSGAALGSDEWWVEGDAPAESTDSRQFGPVRLEQLKAVVRLIYWPRPRRRLL